MTVDDPLLLINAFLGKVGSAGQVFDENNSLALSFDGITIGIRKDDIRQLLVVNAVIAAMPRPSDAASAPALAAAYADILDASLGGIMTGAGALGFSSDRDLLVYGNAIRFDGLSQQGFEAFLERTVNAIEAWHRRAEHWQRMPDDARNFAAPAVEGGMLDVIAV